MPSRTLSWSIALALSALLLSLLASCDDATRYGTLTFFFDGVDPPESPEPVTGPFDPSPPARVQESQGPVWYVHEPSKDCSNCHDKKRQSRAVARAYLVSPVPQLCYGCHEDQMVWGPNVHGPVAVGQCLFCHNPHRTQNKYQLEAPVPDICYLCHDQNRIESIPDHFVTELEACTDCHDPHTSVQRPLLKEAAHRLVAERAAAPPVQRADRPELPSLLAKPLTSDPELHGRLQAIADIYYASMNLYRDGKLVRAREGLIAVLESGLIPHAMGVTIRGHVADIDRKLAERMK